MRPSSSSAPSPNWPFRQWPRTWPWVADWDRPVYGLRADTDGPRHLPHHGPESAELHGPLDRHAPSSGIFEELLFRGVLFRAVETWFGSWAALVVSSLVFGLTDLINPHGTVEGALFIAVEAGILLAAAFMLTRRLWLSIGFHVAWNYTQSAIFSSSVSGNDASQGLIRFTIKGP